MNVETEGMCDEDASRPAPNFVVAFHSLVEKFVHVRESERRGKHVENVHADPLDGTNDEGIRPKQ